MSYSVKDRKPVLVAKTMFKFLTNAYSQNIYSSRKIETACRMDSNLMRLLTGRKAPDHSTIAWYHSGFLSDACEGQLYQLVRRLASTGEFQKKRLYRAM